MKHSDLTDSIAKVIAKMDAVAQNGSAQDVDDHSQACNDVLVENDIILSDCIFSDGWFGFNGGSVLSADCIANEIASQTTPAAQANVIDRFNSLG